MTIHNRYLITLELDPKHSSLRDVKKFTGLKKLNIDKKFGVINVSSRDNLYVVRATGDINPQQLIATQPEIKRIHGDSYISPMAKKDGMTANLSKLFTTVGKKLVGFARS